MGGWVYASHVFLPHDRSTVWRPRWFWSLPCQVDVDCQAQHRPCQGRECLALVAGACFWLPHLHQGYGAIPSNQAILAASFHPSQGTAFLLLLKTISGFLTGFFLICGLSKFVTSVRLIHSTICLFKPLKEETNNGKATNLKNTVLLHKASNTNLYLLSELKQTTNCILIKRALQFHILLIVQNHPPP